jgi:hypothetical protein
VAPCGTLLNCSGTGDCRPRLQIVSSLRDSNIFNWIRLCTKTKISPQMNTDERIYEFKMPY